MKIKSETQKDIYEFESSSFHIKVTKPDGKTWYMPINDARKILYALDLESGIQTTTANLKRTLWSV